MIKKKKKHYVTGEKKWQSSDDPKHLGLVTDRFPNEAILLRINSNNHEYENREFLVLRSQLHKSNV